MACVAKDDRRTYKSKDIPTLQCATYRNGITAPYLTIKKCEIWRRGMVNQ